MMSLSAAGPANRPRTTRPKGAALDRHLLLIDCPDQPGLIWKATGVLLRRGSNIVSNHEFVDRESARFFMRTEFTGDAGPDDLVPEIRPLLPADARVRLTRTGKRRIVVLVTREHHCLGELLLRHAYGELHADILAVIGNHATLAPLAARFDVPFRHAPHEGLTREQHEAAVAGLIDACDPEFVVLAKYMRVLSPEFVNRYPHRIVNIHHSFLPAFVGANPYRQAFARGVKIIGATAHFVTADLDEGPIIAQDVIPVNHGHSSADMAQAGRDVEKLVLARALRLGLRGARLPRRQPHRRVRVTPRRFAMPSLTVEGVGTFAVPADKRLVLALTDEAGVDQLHACGGNARCTTCRVEFAAGEPAKMTDAEKNLLAARGLTGVRLSCQILCDHDMTVKVISRLAGSGRKDAGSPPRRRHPVMPKGRHAASGAARRQPAGASASGAARRQPAYRVLSGSGAASARRCSPHDRRADAAPLPERRAGRSRGRPSTGQDFPHDAAGHVGQPEVAAGVAEGQLLVVKPQQVQDRRVQVVDVDLVLAAY